MADEWVNLDPTPVPEDDPRVRSATLVADGAWFDSAAAARIPADRIRHVVRAVLAHLDETGQTVPRG